ncbi:hypothetical protein ABOZ73_02430 [Caulobacter sp. 73W]|uniref:Uncharacterized protein n=1 Tax=Caulobacter sp. 73W TaxID=3161137 RepID=A0AB39KU81_9CAUL
MKVRSPVKFRWIAAALAVAAATPAVAQTYEAEAARLDALQAQHEIARQQALAAEREALAAQSRADTARTLLSLQAARAGTPSIPDLRYEAPLRPAPLDPAMSADAERIRQLQDRSLAAGNARIRAIEPAPK